MALDKMGLTLHIFYCTEILHNQLGKSISFLFPITKTERTMTIICPVISYIGNCLHLKIFVQQYISKTYLVSAALTTKLHASIQYRSHAQKHIYPLLHDLLETYEIK